MLNTFRKIVFVSLAAVFVLSACATPTTEAPKPVATSAPAATAAAPAATKAPEATKAPAAAVEQVLKLGRATYPDIIDPQKSSFGIEIEVLKLCYEGLTALDAKGNLGPGSADKWTVAADGKSIVFHIRDGLKRADGTAMNASDFEWALKRAVDPRVVGKQYADILSDIKGSGPLLGAKEDAKTPAADVEKLFAGYGVKADDAKRELTVSFDAPAPYWLFVAYIWEAYVPDKKKVDAAPDNWWNKADGHNCYGPFKIKSIEEGKRIVYEANANYWRGKPKLDRIEATYVTDEIQRFEAYKKGEFDITDVTPATIAQVEADPKLKAEFVRSPAAITRQFAFNYTKKPVDNLEVRKAFSQAFNREAWVRDILKGIGKPYTRWIPPGVPGAQPDKPGIPAYDPKAAVETLIKAGLGTADGKKVDCAKLGELKLTYGANAQNHQRFQFVASQILTAFNCPVILDPVDATVATALTKDIKTHPQIAYSGWIQDYPHPQNWLSVYWKSNAFAKRYGYANKDFDTLMVKADATVNVDEALKLYQQGEDLLIKDVPAVFVLYQENLYLVKPNVVGPRENPSSSDAEWAGEWGPVWEYYKK